MRILIGQPKRSDDMDELVKVIENNVCDCILFPEGYLSSDYFLNRASELAKKYKTAIVSSYLADEDRKDRGAVIDEFGAIVFKRMKSGLDSPLLEPSVAIISNTRVGYLLCREMFLDYHKLSDTDIVFNPIGVGMFSEEQFDTWTARAKEIAIELGVIILGASHADGSYRNCGVSIPISYVFDKDGSIIHLSKNDVRSVIIDLDTKSVTYL